MADSVTQLRAAGPVGTKLNLAILGDGFTAADQGAYNTWVQNTVINGVFGHDYYLEDASAWNIWRTWSLTTSLSITLTATWRRGMFCS